VGRGGAQRLGGEAQSELRIIACRMPTPLLPASTPTALRQKIGNAMKFMTGNTKNGKHRAATNSRSAVPITG
jgi:hypothetical protein